MQLLRRISFTMLLLSMMTLVACGGGDLTGGDDGSTPDTVTLTVAKSEGDLSAANDVTITATLLDNGSPLANKTVTFTLAVDGTATFSPASGAVTTNAEGVASIVAKVTDVPGSVNVIATYADVSDNISFNSAGDGQGPPPVGEPQAASIDLFTSTQQLASSGAQSIKLTAIAKDASNNLLEGVTINFSSDSGSLENDLEGSGSSNVTGPDGKVTKLLSTQAEPSNRVITVTITSGDVTDSLAIEVVGTTLTLTGSASLALNDEASYIVNVLDSDGNGIANTGVAISLSGVSTETPAGSVANITVPVSATTDADGQAIINATGTSGGTNSIIVTALGASASQDVSVQADSFQYTSFSNGVDTVDPSVTPVVPDVSLVQTATVTLTWQRNGSPVADGTPVSFTTTRGVLTADTDMTLNGEVTVTLTSTDAGKALVTFVGSDTVDSKSIELTNQLEFEFFADTAATIKGQASPNSIGPNEQTSTISVVVKDDNGNLVKNEKVKFVLEDISGGSIFPATAVTDSSGSASTIYTSKSTSAKDAVLITAIVEDNTGIKDTISLTVSDRELFISLGTGNKVEELGTTDYIKEYSVFVTDAESNAVENVELTVSAIPESYYKGLWVPTYDGDEFIIWVAMGAGFNPKAKCDNEDANFNGILDDGEDFNGDGELTPGNIVSISGDFVTDSDGRSVIRVIYPQSYAHWLDAKLVVSGKVTGSESSTQTIFTLPVLADHVTNEDETPPHQGIGTRGPFGLSQTCSDNISQDVD